MHLFLGGKFLITDDHEATVERDLKVVIFVCFYCLSRSPQLQCRSEILFSFSLSPLPPPSQKLHPFISSVCVCAHTDKSGQLVCRLAAARQLPHCSPPLSPTAQLPSWTCVLSTTIHATASQPAGRPPAHPRPGTPPARSIVTARVRWPN